MAKMAVGMTKTNGQPLKGTLFHSYRRSSLGGLLLFLLWRGEETLKSRNPDYFWLPGDSVTEEDRRILQPVLEAYAELGRTPTRHEVGQLSRIKARFRIWEHAVLAAGLPSLKDPTQVLLRRKDQEEKKRYLQENWPLSRNIEQEGKVPSRNTEQEGKATSRNME